MATKDLLIMMEKAPQPLLPPLDYTADDMDAAECLLMLSLSGAGDCLLPSSPSAPTKSSSPATAPPTCNSVRKVKYTHMCDVCPATFTSHQALGGHKTLHRPKSTTAAAAAVSRSTVALKLDGKGHVCSICHQKFPSGQALGGHKRKHYEGVIGPVIYNKSCKTSSGGSPGDNSVVTHVEEDGRRQDLDLNQLPYIFL
ncbi:hypothetical protein OROHE_024471 [Orobanche hederae]